MSRGRNKEERKQGVPSYIVTFSDMITLLLTFFVLLLSMAEKQVEDHKFMAGIAAFDRALSEFGMSGILFNSQNKSRMQHRKPEYRVDSNEEKTENRSIDAQTEMLRRILLDIEQMMKISPSHIAGMDKNYLPSGVVFEKGTWTLDSESRKKLTVLSESIQVNYAQSPPIVYILGLAGNEQSEHDQWKVSVNRSQEVCDFLRQQLPKNAVRGIYCWGAGDGGEWVEYSGQISQKSQILIAVLNENES